MSRTSFAIVGGGIVGLSIAREILLRAPRAQVVVFEKEPDTALHASGRNSGVLHAGFYYAPDSLKAKLTRNGNLLLRTFCRSVGVPVLECGKVVVTRDESELPALHALFDRGQANGVELELINAAGISELEPLARTHQRTLWSPTTAVADPMGVTRAVGEDVKRRGGHIVTDTEVKDARPGEVLASTREDGPHIWKADHTINCAGLYSDRVAGWFGFCDAYEIVPFKGLYRYGRWEPGWLRRHVYPVPDPRNPFLGVHATVTVDHRVKIGPTAIPVLGREQYGRWSGFHPRESAASLAGLLRFLGSDAHDSASLIRTELPKYSHKHLAHEAARLVVLTTDVRYGGWAWSR